MTNSEKIYRLNDDYIIAGICSGLAKHFNVDPTIVRLIFILLSFGGGSGVLIYLILWFVIPKEEGKEKEINREEKVKEFANDVKNKAKTMAKDINLNTKIKKTGRVNIMAVVLMLVGVVAIWNQIFPMTIEWHFFWPVILILIGISLLTKK
jgi:phage shock protein PspC (stress-responsive transcriptional regulator)